MLAAIADKLFPPTCMSLTAAERPCRHKVDHWGERCADCWQELADPEQASIEQRIQLAKEQFVPESVLSRLARDPIVSVRMMAARHPMLPKETQLAIMRQQEVAVLRSLITNPNLDRSLLPLFAQHPDQLIQEILVEMAEMRSV